MPIEECFPDLWIQPDVLAADLGIDVEDATPAIEEASWMLWSLTYQRYSSNWIARRDSYRMRPGVSEFVLHSGPVAKIFAVKVINLATGEERDTDFVYLLGGKIRIGGKQISPCHPSTANQDLIVQVEYLTKPNLPAGSTRAVKRLSMELYLSASGSDDCSLPERVTSVNRQGVSWTLLDPMTFMQEGLIGIGPIDQWIVTTIRRGVIRVIDPLAWLERAETEVFGCGEDFEP